jgi:hypothetical protein
MATILPTLSLLVDLETKDAHLILTKYADRSEVARRMQR